MLDYSTPTEITPLIESINRDLDELYEAKEMLYSLDTIIRFFRKKRTEM